ncbi:DUF6278 family protein, partial [Pseudomonas sp. 100_A]|uniref:DUF6278 family protein n=1 Tax=Pseudomonas sp. 100_A TaxID=2813571 RepID=UPI0034D2D2D5
MIDIRRWWRRGRHHGTAQGVVVFGSPGFDDDQQGLRTLLGRHERLTEGMRAAGLELEVSGGGLRVVDSMIEGWVEDPIVAPGLINDVGFFLGNVLVQEIPDAQWRVWPNGHPVVQLADGREFDVTAQAAARVQRSHPPLTDILD